MDKLSLELLKQITDLDNIPNGAHNFRINGKSDIHNSTANIEIISKKDKQGANIVVKKGTINEIVYIPVLLTQAGLKDLVYNDFYIGDNSDVTIIAGCGIHNCSNQLSEHNGIHTFHIGKNSKVKYVEKHLGIGENSSDRVLNPTTKIYMEDGSFMLMEMAQIGGVSFADRKSIAKLKNNSKLIIQEKILTTDKQIAKTKFTVNLNGKKSSVEISSRSVAKNNSLQILKSSIVGKNECFGHVECDGIIINNGQIFSTPEIKAQNINSMLIHEAAIGKIAGDELIKLETLGLTEKEAEEKIISGFLK